MIKYTTGNILASNSEALVNTVNTVGVMGKGIALQFKEAFPSNYAAYVHACKEGSLAPGKLLVTKERTLAGEEKIIINFPTKKHWRHPSKYEYIEDGLSELKRIIYEHQIKSIAIPPLGCGNGGLQWSRVREMIESVLKDVDATISVYQPNATIKQTLQKETRQKEIKLTPARGLLLYAMFYYDSLGENCSLFVANKLVYFLQRFGANPFARIKFSAGHFGPYSPGVDHLVYDLNGSFFKGDEQMSASAFEPLTMEYNRIKEVSTYVRTLSDRLQASLKDTIKLIDGFESTLALEVLASVDFVRRENPEISLDNTIDAIHKWSTRKNKLFKDEYIKIAYHHLEEFQATPRGLF